MPDTCPTCGAEVRIVGETTKHYEAGRSLDALNTQAKAVSRLRERVEELEERVREAYCDGYRQGVEDQREGFVSADSTVKTLAENWCIDRARQALDTGEDNGC